MTSVRADLVYMVDFIGVSRFIPPARVDLVKKPRFREVFSGATNRNRTDDLVITNDVLCHLSYSSIPTVTL